MHLCTCTKFKQNSIHVYTYLFPIFDVFLSHFSCIPAYPKIPDMIVKKYCHPLYISDPKFCKPDVISSELLFASHEKQKRSDRGISNVYTGKKILDNMENFYVRPSCIEVYREVTCKSLFPKCVLTSSIPIKRQICQETCNDLYKMCDREYNMTLRFNELGKHIPYRWRKRNCSSLPYRNAGDIRECYHSSRLNSELIILNFIKP